jgi:hypothetical protein
MALYSPVSFGSWAEVEDCYNLHLMAEHYRTRYAMI